MAQPHSTASVDEYLDSPEFETLLTQDDDSAARAHLAAGRPVYYRDERLGDGIVKEYPDGRRQLLHVSMTGEISIIRDL